MWNNAILSYLLALGCVFALNSVSSACETLDDKLDAYHGKDPLAISAGLNYPQTQITGAILPTSEGHYLPYSINGRPTAGWKLTEESIRKAEPVILAFLKNAEKNIYQIIEQYRCQYFGIIVNGKKRIYCNFFRIEKYEEKWRTKPLIVVDGGSNFFQLEYDIETDKCLNFTINGVA